MCCHLTFRPLLEFEDGKRKLDFRFSDDRLNVWNPSFTLEGVSAVKRELDGKEVHGGKVVDLVSVPCGHCVECLRSRSESWAARIACEIRSLDSRPHSCCFVTLTLDDVHQVIVKGKMTLSLKMVQDFLKRLRWYVRPSKLRYFLCGEYGPQTLRPHYHAILMLEGSSDDASFSSAIRKAWPFGFLQFDFDVGINACAYVARYVDKKIESGLKDKDFEKLGLVPPFLLSSKGLGKDWIVDNASRIDSLGYVPLADGRRSSIPRYFDRVLDSFGLTASKESKSLNSDRILDQGLLHSQSLSMSLGQWLSLKDSLLSAKKKALKRKDL